MPEPVAKRPGRPPSTGGPATGAQREAARRARAEASGGGVLPSMVLSPAAYQALMALVEQHGSKRAAIEHLLTSAADAVQTPHPTRSTQSG